jgi:hypothetical protein
MRFNVGDRVKFLNEKGGGIVTKIISSSLVQVAIEDGFEIPTMTSDLVKVEDDDQISDYYERMAQAPVPAPAGNQPPENIEDRITPLVRYASRQNFQQGVYLAFVPHEQKWLITGPVDIYLINYTDFDLLFSLFLREENGGYTGVDYDAVSALSKCLLNTIQRDDIGMWGEGIIQTLFHKDHIAKVLVPGSATFRIRPVKFVREANYIQSVFLPERAIIISMHTIDESTAATGEGKEAASDKELPPPHTHAKNAVTPALIDRHRIAARVAEVDLHISALKDDYKDLKNHEILGIQSDYFIRTLESAIENHYYKIYFIHGVGNGTLKAKVQEYLKDYNESLEYRDAPYDKYGTGAVEVVIKENL